MAEPSHPLRRSTDHPIGNGATGAGPNGAAPGESEAVVASRRVQLRGNFREELNALEASALGGFDMVIEQLDRVATALETQDAGLASFIVADDDRLDGRYLEVNQGILSLLARQAPVAGDLRLVAALLHLIKHVERMGDQCANIAKFVPLVGEDAPRQMEVVVRLVEMGRLVRSEVVQARQAFELRDVALARNVEELDQQVNVLNREIFRFAIDLGTDADEREWLLTMAMVARAFERIGDNAVDIGELVSL
ncbi:MAG: phosphate signaling complex protein PhoU, partial [Solirubrobacteraceae bacterium]|nr:phosphate signaling complex protein PhoU [Patulibacter sp.]